MRRGLVLIAIGSLVGACTSHGAREPDWAEAFCANETGDCGGVPCLGSIEVTCGGCATCWDVGADGRGTCRLPVNTATPPELAAVFQFAVSSRDRWRTQGAQCRTELAPLAELVAAHLAVHPIDRLTELKELGGRPDLFIDTTHQGLELRTTGANNTDGNCWGGMADVAVAAFPEPSAPFPVPTCCVGLECTGADYACQHTESGALQCRPAEPPPAP